MEGEHFTCSQTGIFPTAERVSSAFLWYSSVCLVPTSTLTHNCWGAADQGTPRPWQHSMSPAPDMEVKSF